MQSNIVVCDLNQINMSSRFLTLNIPNGDVEIDIKKMMQEPLNSNRAYFNATTIAKLYKKDISNFKRTEGYVKYLQLLNRDYHGIEMSKTTRGKHGGTWFHSKLMLKFILWIDTELEYEFHRFLENLIIHTNELKIERDNTKILFKDLTKVIRDVYIPAQESDNAKKFAYNNLSGLVNIKVLGSTGSKYAKDNGIEVEDGKSVRDYLSKELLDEITEVERKLSGFIEFGGITDYEKLKEKLC
jgi:hypothetical protein